MSRKSVLTSPLTSFGHYVKRTVRFLNPRSNVDSKMRLFIRCSKPFMRTRFHSEQTPRPLQRRNTAPISARYGAGSAILTIIISLTLTAIRSLGGTVAPSNFSFTDSLAGPRNGHVAVLLSNGKVLVAGGSDNEEPLVSSELYDPATGHWTATGNSSSAFVLATATLLQNGKVLVVGGGANVVQLYDPATGSWSVTGNLHQARRFHTATLSPNGKVLVAGGSAGGTSMDSAALIIGAFV